MKTFITTILALTLCAGLALPQGKGKGKGPQPPGLALTSPDFEDGGVIPDKYTGAAGPAAVSPTLRWSNVPAGTQAFALIFHDPDVAINKNPDDVLHWMVFNIPGTATQLAGGVAEGAALPDGTVQAKNLRGTSAYMGPGNGAQNPYHHYTFELFALDAKLPLDANASRADVLKAMEGHILGKGVLVGRFKRPN